MSGGFGAGLADSLLKEQELSQNKALEEQRLANEGKQVDAQVQSEQDADTRANEMQPGALDEQAARTDQAKAGTAATTQATQQNAQAFPDELRAKHYQMLQQQLGLNDTEMAQTHTAAIGLGRAVAAEATGGGKVDAGAIESAYNQGAAPGTRIKQGTLAITPDTNNPGNTQISYIGDDGRPRVTTLQNWTDLESAFMPPVKGEVVPVDARLANPVTGATILPAATNTPIGKTDPTAWTGQVSRQMATAFGGLLDVNGNVTNLTQDQSNLVNALSGAASKYGQQSGYAAPAPEVAAAVKQAYDENKVSTNLYDTSIVNSPKFQARVQQLLQQDQGGYGVNPNGAPPAQSGQQPTSQGGQPYAEGTRLQGTDGKTYVVQNGQPVLESNQ